MEGTDSSGNAIHRVAPIKVIVAESELKVVMDVADEGVLNITPGDDLVVTLSVTNVGSSANTYQIDARDTLDFFQSASPAM